jgi:hypothetical protein
VKKNKLIVLYELLKPKKISMVMSSNHPNHPYFKINSTKVSNISPFLTKINKKNLKLGREHKANSDSLSKEILLSQATTENFASND